MLWLCVQLIVYLNTASSNHTFSKAAFHEVQTDIINWIYLTWVINGASNPCNALITTNLKGSCMLFSEPWSETIYIHFSISLLGLKAPWKGTVIFLQVLKNLAVNLLTCPAHRQGWYSRCISSGGELLCCNTLHLEIEWVKINSFGWIKRRQNIIILWFFFLFIDDKYV